MNDEETLSFECKLDEPPAQVWRALTEPELLAQWLLPITAQEGREFTLQGETKIDCEVLSIEHERRLQLRWRERELDSVVTFTLTPAITGGTYLRVEHTGAESLEFRCAA